MKGQTVNYKYDINGNVLSKRIVESVNVTNLSIKTDPIYFIRHFGTYSYHKFPVFFNRISTPVEDELEELSKVKVDETLKEKIPDISSFPDSTGYSLFIADKKRNYKSY